MSYARFSEGDIYLYHGGSAWICMSCVLTPQLENCMGFHDDSRMTTIQEVWDHVQQHQQVGHRVPQRCLDRIQQELENSSV